MKITVVGSAYTVGLAAGAIGGSLAGKAVAVLGAPYRGGVKETAFSRVFATVEALREAGATVLVQHPMYAAEELARYGWDAYDIGAPLDVVVAQADHAEYPTLSAGDFPGVDLVVDGRRVLDPAKFADTRRLVVAQAAPGG